MPMVVEGNEVFKRNMNRKDEGLTEQDYADFRYEVDDVISRFPAIMDPLNDVIGKKYNHVYAVGIGNSLYAPESLKFNFRENSGVDIDVFETMEFNAYYVNYLPENSLVLICSHGGAAARTVETVYVAKKRGATVISLTCKETSRLNSSCEHHLCCTQHNEKAYIWGNNGYETLALMYALLGVRMGELNGHLTKEQAEKATEDIRRAAYIGYETCMKYDDLMVKFGNDAKDQKKIYYLGAGPSYIMAEHGCAKLMEQCALDGIHQQIEEYGHQQYWVHNRNGNNDFMVMICPKGVSQKRAKEDLTEFKFLNLRSVLITTCDADEEMKKMADYVIESTEPVSENLFAFVSSKVLARMANRLALAIGNMGERFKSQDQYADHYVTIHYSRFLDEVAEYDIPMPDKETIESVGPQGLKFDKKN